jgi:hypothetical protein
MDLMAGCEELLQAGLYREVGPDGDFKAAYRAWYAREMQRRDRERRQRWEGGGTAGERHGV